MPAQDLASLLHFLIVDDDAESRSTVVEYLRSMGYSRVTLAHDGAEAIRLLERDATINFILSDWEMPMVNGLSLLQRVKMHPDRAHIPFIVMTSPSSQETEKVIKAAENLVDGYLIKPFRSQVLKDKIKAVLTTAALGSKRQIVIVDDDEDARETVIEYMKKIGFKEVVSFSDGVSAWKHVIQNAAKVGLIISDWEMPEMSGLDFLRACKGDKSLADIPFLMITSQSSIERMKVMEAARANVDQYLLKPFKVDDFQQRVQEVLDKARYYPEIKKLLGEGFEELENGHFNNAISIFEEVLKMQPDHEAALRGIGDAVCKQKNIHSSVPYYKKAIETNPTQPKSYLRLASVYEQLSWPDRALALLQTANQQVIFNADLHYALGRLYQKKGMLDEARLEFEKTLEIQVDHSEARLMLDLIESEGKGSES